MANRKKCLNCGNPVPRGRGASQIYCCRECWMAKPPKVVAVEAEFDESFYDVVRGFAEMGYSQTATAQVLEFNLPYFRSLLKKFELLGHFLPQSQQRAECRGAVSQRVRGTKRSSYSRAPKYTDEYLLSCVAASSSSYDFHIRFMIDPGTIRNRFGSWKSAKRLTTA